MATVKHIHQILDRNVARLVQENGLQGKVGGPFLADKPLEDWRDFDAYSNRPPGLQAVIREDWNSWKWQSRNTANNLEGLLKFFPDLPKADRQFAEILRRQGERIKISPHLAACTEKDRDGNPLAHDPIWMEHFPVLALHRYGVERLAAFLGTYSPSADNWEATNEMPTRALHHKYDDRALLRATDTCFSYCKHCYLAVPSDDPGEKHHGLSNLEPSLDYIKAHPEINEVILSGGDPLVLKNEKLDEILGRIRQIPSVNLVRIHTRAAVHNPARMDEGFAELLKRHRVNRLGFHVTHPNQVNRDFSATVERLRNHGVMTSFFNQHPVLKGINDYVDVLYSLNLSLVGIGIEPYSAIHFKENTVGRDLLGGSVRRMAVIQAAFNGTVSGAVTPKRFCLNPKEGKVKIPLEIEGTPDFQYVAEGANKRIVFTDWKGNKNCSYPDGHDDYELRNVHQLRKFSLPLAETH